MARRLAGALTTPLDAEALLLTAVLLAATAAATRLAWQQLPAAQRSTGTSSIVWVLPALGLLAFVVALSLPGSPVWALRAFWACTCRRRGDFDLARMAKPGSHRLNRRTTPRGIGCRDFATVDARVEEQADEPHLPAITSVDGREIRVDPPQQPSPHIIPPNVSQQLTRAIGDDGCEVLYGLLRGHFAPGQRSLRLHVSFCPQFDTVPEVSVDKIEGPELTIRVGQVLPYGAQTGPATEDAKRRTGGRGA